MKVMIDSLQQDFSDKKVLLKESDAAFAKAIAAKIFKELNCEVHIVKDLPSLKEGVENTETPYFVGIFDYTSGASDDIQSIDYALSKSLPVIALTESFDDDTRDTLLSKNIVDYVLKRSTDDIDYLVRLIRQLARNSAMEVLIAEDSSVYRKNLVDILKNQLFTTYEAKDGEEALDMIKKHENIKLVLTDYFMPNMDGFELVTKLRKTKSKDELAIIAISSDTSEMVVSKFLKFGATDYIKKPYSKEEFICRINNHVEHIALIEFQKELANFDFLTGLYNRKYLVDTGKTLHANAIRGNIEFIVGMMDIDNFKLINDRYGHDVGDMVIKDFAKRLKECFRSSDIVCRFGGEEFCVLLTNVEDKHIDFTFDKFLHAVRNSEIVTKQKEIVQYTVSIGVCATLQSSFEAMIKVADEKLYEAKRAGKDRVVTDIIPS
jgi:diguanylate cyclase (GGDEF)-like protein